jgi:hypothetical protein
MNGPRSTVSDVQAKGILTSEFLKLRALNYQDLVDRLADEVERFDAVGLSGKTYNVELQGYWDDDEHRDLRVDGDQFGVRCHDRIGDSNRHSADRTDRDRDHRRQLDVHAACRSVHAG